MENETVTGQEAKVGAESPVSPSQTETGGQSASPSVSSEPNQPQNNLPFDKHPRWQELQRERRQERQQMQELRQKYQEQQAYLDGMRRQSGPQGPQISQEDEALLEKFFTSAFASPKVTKMLEERFGTSKLSDLEKRMGGFEETWHGSQFNSELKEIKAYVKDLGLDADEVEQAIQDAVESDPVYSQVNFKPGAVKAIFRNLYWDRMGELQERSVNKKQLEKKEALKRGQTQSTAETGTAAKGALSKDPGERMRQVIQNAGGMGNIDFTR